MEECTFQPQGLSKKSEPTKFDANEFYQRNLEWKQRIEAEDSKKQDEQLKLVTVNSLLLHEIIVLSYLQKNQNHSVPMRIQRF